MFQFLSPIKHGLYLVFPMFLPLEHCLGNYTFTYEGPGGSSGGVMRDARRRLRSNESPGRMCMVCCRNWSPIS